MIKPVIFMGKNKKADQEKKQLENVSMHPTIRDNSVMDLENFTRS